MLVPESQSRRSFFDFSQSRKYSYPAHLATKEITHYFFLLVKEALNISLQRSQRFILLASPQILRRLFPSYSGQSIYLKSGPEL